MDTAREVTLSQLIAALDYVIKAIEERNPKTKTEWVVLIADLLEFLNSNGWTLADLHALVLASRWILQRKGALTALKGLG